jgi:hypothetical protein
MLAFWHYLAQWSEKTFGSRDVRGSTGPLKHLEKEAREAYMETDPQKRRVEIADCLFLVFDAARREGMSYDDLLATVMTKLEVNQSRTWPPASADEPVEHVREGGE